QLRAMIAAPFPPAIAADFEERFGMRGIETYGMSEISTVAWHPYDEPLRPGSCGRPLPDLFDVTITDPDTDEELPPGTIGEISVLPLQPWLTTLGYVNMPEKTVEAWRNLRFRTGDSGYFDEAGYLYFVDRTGDRIRRRAENISAYDIE